MPLMYDPTTMTLLEEAEDEKCERCGTAVYWADYYTADGSMDRRLFNVGNKRKHVCEPSSDDFDVVPE